MTSLVLTLVLTAAKPAAAPAWKPSAAYGWMDTILETAAREVERDGARPTILSRAMAESATAMYDAWAAYDARAVGTELGGSLRRPARERTQANKEKAIAYAVYRTLLDLYPEDAQWVTAQMKKRGYDPADTSTDPETPQGVGNLAAAAVLASRHHDGANQLGDEVGSNGKPYSDYTYYAPVNTVQKLVDVNRWQPIPFEKKDGSGTWAPGFLTPQWYRVRPFALERSDQFRPGPPPKVGSPEMQKDVDEVISLQANLTPEQKALVEFMRDGPRSTGQSGHWLTFAMDVALRDHDDLDRDAKLFFAEGNTAFDAFIACWDAKRFYDSSRPWTLVRVYDGDKQIEGWLGPGKGVGKIRGDQWRPYSPSTFLTPPFPGYTSGHSTVSGAGAKMLELFTGSDHFGIVEKRHAGALTEDGIDCAHMQQRDGQKVDANCDVSIDMPTFSKTAEIAGMSRIMGGYHIQADNQAGLALGRKLAVHEWRVVQTYFDGTAKPRPAMVFDARQAVVPTVQTVSAPKK